MIDCLVSLICCCKRESEAGRHGVERPLPIAVSCAADDPSDHSAICRHDVVRYTYSPFTTDKSIRLLHVLPGRQAEPLRCTLTFCSLETSAPNAQYEAISYWWGEDKRYTQGILIDDRRHYTTKSAEEVLLHIRSIDRVRTIWIDSICINQSNDDERSEQVRMMDVVYGNAEETIVWLEMPVRDDERALDFIEKHEELFEEIATNRLANIDMLLEKHNLTSQLTPWIDISELTCRNWFRRAWVVQELALSRQVRVNFGYRSISWDVFSAAILCCVSPSIDVTNRRTEFSGLVQHGQVRKLSEIREQIQQGRKIDLKTAFNITLSLSASVRHDFIFALLGILRDDQKRKLAQLTYETAIDQVFLKALRIALEDECDLSIFYGVAYAQDTFCPLPSWVPDFSDFRRALHLPIGLGSSLLDNVRAWQSRPVWEAPTFSACGNVMSLSGSLVDEVALLSPVFIDEQDVYEHDVWWRNHWARPEIEEEYPMQGKARWRAWIDVILSAISGCQRADDLEDVYNKLARTLCGCYFGSTEHCRKAFDIWRQLYLERNYSNDFFIASTMKLVSTDIALTVDRAGITLANAFASKFQTMCAGRRLCITTSGQYGIVPRGTAIGDFISILIGSAFPFLLRIADESVLVKRRYHLVGTCYLDGIMYGEGLESRVFEKLDLI